MRRKEQTDEEIILEKSIRLALSGLEMQQEWRKTIKMQEKDYSFISEIIGMIGNSVVKIKCFIDDCLGEERARKIHDFISKLIL